MQPKYLIWMASLLLAGRCSAAIANDLYVACHAGVTIAASDVRDVFLGERQYLQTTRLVPVDNVSAQPDFLERVLKMNGDKYATTWAKKSFRDGLNPPAALANDAAVLEFLKRTPGACGYLTTQPPQGVAVIGKY